MIWIRSALFNLIMVVTGSAFAVVVVLAFPFPPLTRYRLATIWGRAMVRLARWLCGIDFRVEGREHLPKGPAILLSKHQSAWETLAFQGIFPPQVWVLKRELLWVPFFGWGLAMTQPIAINRGAGRKAITQIIEQGRQRLESGRWVVVFPEGTRVEPGKRGRYGIGGAALAAETGYPVVPVAHNAGNFWRRNGFRKTPGLVRVVIGPTIDSRGKTPEQIRQLVEGWIETTMAEIEHRPVAPRG